MNTDNLKDAIVSDAQREIRAVHEMAARDIREMVDVRAMTMSAPCEEGILDSTFLSDGRPVAWGDATIADHRYRADLLVDNLARESLDSEFALGDGHGERVDLLVKVSDTETASLHAAAINKLREFGARTLREIPEHLR